MANVDCSGNPLRLTIFVGEQSHGLNKYWWRQQYLFVGLQRTKGFFSKCCRKSTPDDYVSDFFGRNNYTVIDRVERLQALFERKVCCCTL